jgi:hypothetical protein
VYEESERFIEENHVPFEEVLTPETLGTLPLEWLSSLLNASERLQGWVLDDLVDQLPPENASIADTVTDLIENFKFETLSAAISRAIKLKEEQGE